MLKIMMNEDIHVKTMECKYIVSFVVSFSSFLSHRNHRTVKWGQREKSQKTDVMLNQNPMSSSEYNESKSYPELDESALLVAQVKLPRVFEIRSLDSVGSLVTQGHFGPIMSGCLLAINSPPLHHKLVAAQS